MGNILKVLASDTVMKENYQIFGIYSKRHPDLEANCSLKSNPADRDDKCYPFKTIVRLFTDPDRNTHEEAKEWGKQLCGMAKGISDAQDMYKTTFVVGQDMSQENLLPPCTHLLDEDVMDIIDGLYPNTSRAEQADCLAEEFFGSWKGAQAFIRDFPEQDHDDVINGDEEPKFNPYM